MRKTAIAIALLLSAADLIAQSAAGLHWTAPSGWKAEAARPMRAATYSVPAVAGDQGMTECVINFFGPGQGGSVEANLDRWSAQVRRSDGSPARPIIAKKTVRGIPMTTFDASGSYVTMGAFMTATPKAVIGHRVLGAIVEGPGGTVFVKLTGPEKTVAANQKKFEELLASFAPDK